MLLGLCDDRAGILAVFRLLVERSAVAPACVWIVRTAMTSSFIFRS